MVLVVADRAEPRRALERVDWSLLVFFVSLFIVVAALGKTGLPEQAWRAAAPWMGLRDPGGITAFSALLVVGSNLFSNVPMVLLTGPHLTELGDPSRGWVLLAFVTTIAGNLTLIGSVANIIVAEQAKQHYTLGFFEYLRFGAVSTLLVLCAGIPLICLGTGSP
ncbi:MAG: anion transporter, partial [Deltaproteobacteria bacterium]|nr:anion transporter [Deltaproteobacteria bacterium]